MHFQIFIPNATGADPRHLDKVGLGHLLRPGDAGPVMGEVIGSGPSGGPGLLFTWPGSAPIYRAGELTWRPAKPDNGSPRPGTPGRGAGGEGQALPQGRFWYGINPASPPTPQDLARSEQLAGASLDLGGQAWRMPNILLLPHHYILDEQGEEAREVQPSFTSIYQRGMWAFDLLKAQIAEQAPAPAAELRRYVIEMLGLNYRLFRDLAYELHLLTDENWFTLACHSVDIQTLLQIEQDIAKKKQLAWQALITPPTSPPGVGPEASPQPGTSPQFATS